MVQELDKRKLHTTYYNPQLSYFNFFEIKDGCLLFRNEGLPSSPVKAIYDILFLVIEHMWRTQMGQQEIFGL